MECMTKLEDWLSAVPSKQTRKCYRNGVKRFERFTKKPIDSMLEMSDEDLGHIMEKFYAVLSDEGTPQNTKRNVVNCAIQFFKYHGKNPKYRKALGIYRTVQSTRDMKLSITTVQEMAKVSDLREQIILEAWLLGLRISDASILEWQKFTEDEFTLCTRKEQIVAHIFVSAEFRELLTKYLPLLEKNNRFLFQSKKNEHLTVKHLDYILKAIAKRAGIPEWGRIHWHLARKLVLRTSAELGLSLWSAKMIIGKSIPSADSTYLQGTELKADADKIHEVIRLFPKNGNGNKVGKLEELVLSLEKENAQLKQRIEILQQHFEGIKKQIANMQEDQRNQAFEILELQTKNGIKPKPIKKID